MSLTCTPRGFPRKVKLLSVLIPPIKCLNNFLAQPYTAMPSIYGREKNIIKEPLEKVEYKSIMQTSCWHCKVAKPQGYKITLREIFGEMNPTPICEFGIYLRVNNSNQLKKWVICMARDERWWQLRRSHALDQSANLILIGLGRVVVGTSQNSQSAKATIVYLRSRWSIEANADWLFEARFVRDNMVVWQKEVEKK